MQWLSAMIVQRPVRCASSSAVTRVSPLASIGQPWLEQKPQYVQPLRVSGSPVVRISGSVMVEVAAVMHRAAADAARHFQNFADESVVAFLGPVAERARLGEMILVDVLALAELELVVGKILGLEPRAFLEHADVQARLGEHVGDDAAA